MLFDTSKFDAISGLNAKRGLDGFEDDIEDYLAAIRSFLRNAPKAADKLRNVTEENLSEYAINIHGVKSMSAWICAEDINANAIKLETMAKAGDISGVSAQNDKFLKDLEAFTKDLQSLLDDSDK